MQSETLQKVTQFSAKPMPRQHLIVRVNRQAWRCRLRLVQSCWPTCFIRNCCLGICAWPPCNAVLQFSANNLQASPLLADCALQHVQRLQVYLKDPTFRNLSSQWPPNALNVTAARTSLSGERQFPAQISSRLGCMCSGHGHEGVFRPIGMAAAVTCYHQS